ncbi:S1 RNA-binding domain-containing protein [Pseudomonas aeruginosa]
MPGMVLEGVVTNVTNFGAFVDIGVHQDGLVHISALSEKFVKDPYEVVKAGDIVKVKVHGSGHPAQPCRPVHAHEATPRREGRRPARRASHRRGQPRQERGAPRGQSAPPANNAMAALFANAKQLKKK